MKILRLFFLMILTEFCLAATPANACKCAQPEITKESAAGFPYIFTATVQRPVTHIGKKYIQTTVLRVQESFKGDAAGDLLPLHNKTSCAFQFEDGKTYLVFATINDQIHLSASQCSPTRAIESDQDIPAFLRAKALPPETDTPPAEK